MPRRAPHLVRPSLALLWLALASPLGLAGAPPPRTVTLAVGFEGRGTAPAAIDSADLAVTSPIAGVELASVGNAASLAGQWQVAIYVDQQLTGTGSILRFLESLAAVSEALTALGEVQLVMVDEDPATVVRTSDPELLAQVLSQQSLRGAGAHGVRDRRLALLESLAGGGAADATAEAEAALAAELALQRARQDELVEWIAAQGRPTGPRALFFLAGAAGLDARLFYQAWVDDVDAALRAAGGLPDLDELGTVLASYGWSLLPTIVPFERDADEDKVSLRTNQSIGFKVRLGGGDKEEERRFGPEQLLLDAGRVEAGARLVRLTGGRAAASLEELPAVVASLAGRLPLEVRLPADVDLPVPIDVVARDPDLAVRAPRLVGGSPEAVAELRMRRALEGEGDPGELPLRARIHVEPSESDTGPAELDLLVDLEALAGDGPVRLRVSVGVHVQEGDLLTEHAVHVADPAADTTFALRRPLPLPPSTDAAIVVVEALSAGIWGEILAEFVSRTTEAGETASLPDPDEPAPAGPALRLTPLPAEARTGRVRVRPVTRPDVREVVFLLDGERVETRRRPPYDARLDLGRVPEQRSIIAIAYDAAGREIGRDGLIVNEAATTFWVQIAEPAPGNRVGPVDVVTAFRVPEGDTLERIDYYWNDALVGTTRSEPHRERVLVPVDRPAGYIRVVARLASGKTAEDVVLLNTQRFETEITVELVELYVVVTDSLGRPVRGLDRADFVVREEHEVQNVESFAVAGDLPLTLGLAIDSSLSLFKKLPDVQAAAVGFVDRLRADRDRAFLVEYGSTPRLVQPITSDLERIAGAIRSLQPSGNTAVWEGVTLSLSELRESVGRRALVVFYDGDDEDENYSFKKTLDLARQTRIPIYLIVMNDEAARTQGKGFAVRSRIARLDQIARTGGGRVFYVHTDEDLSPIFAEIDAELRSHYLLTYYPQRPVEHPEWRPITVELTRADLTARTISGYGGG